MDREAVEYLEAKIHMSAKDARLWSRDQYFTEIDGAKRDMGGLTLDEILQKDYKQWTENGLNLGVSSVVKPLDFLVKKANPVSSTHAFGDELQRFVAGRDLSIFAIMTTFTSQEGDFRRELLLQVRKAAYSSVSKFAKRAIPGLKLQSLEVEGISTQGTSAGDWLSIWIQNDVSKSRKQVAPLLREAMRS